MIYEYKCPACSNTTERITNDYNLRSIPCSVCGAQAVRIISLSKFDLIGNNWARDGYTTQAEKRACPSWVHEQARLDGRAVKDLQSMSDINKGD